MDWSNYKFHCSSLGALLTEPRSGPGLSETCKAHLLECWIKETYGREKDDTNKYVEKGNMVEEDSITLYSRVSRKLFNKNSETFENDFIVGTPDIITKDSVIDIKSSWTIYTFFTNIHKPLNKDYVWQINGYMALLGLNAGWLVYCLVNTPEVIVEQEKSRLRYKMGIIDPEANETYVQAAANIDLNSNFDDIPIDKRFMGFKVPEMDMKKAYKRVKECREFLTALS